MRSGRQTSWSLPCSSPVRLQDALCPVWQVSLRDIRASSGCLVPSSTRTLGLPRCCRETLEQGRASTGLGFLILWRTRVIRRTSVNNDTCSSHVRLRYAHVGLLAGCRCGTFVQVQAALRSPAFNMRTLASWPGVAEGWSGKAGLTVSRSQWYAEPWSTVIPILCADVFNMRTLASWLGVAEGRSCKSRLSFVRSSS
jgi:hypothetical protein